MAVSTIDPNGLNVGQLGGTRNLIINGAMTLAQRSTSETSVSASGYKTVDRFYHTSGGSATSVWTISQSTDAPDGFANSLKYECTTAQSSITSSQNIAVQYIIEGQDLQQVAKGTSNAKQMTISFNVKSSKTGTYIVSFYDGDNNRNCSQAYTINSANTWEYKTITIPADTTGTFDNDNAASLYVAFFLAAGDSLQSGTLATTWESYNAANRCVGQVNLGDATSNTWQITGVQLEVGGTATDFEQESYATTLQKAQRYFNNLVSYGGSSVTGVLNLASYSTNNTYGVYTFPVEMRAAPSVSYSNLADFKSRFGNNVTPTSITTHGSTSNKQTTIQVAATSTAGQAGWLEAINSSAYIYLDAEL